MNEQREVTIYGRLGNNPELRRTKKNNPFCIFSLAESTDNRTTPQWHNVVMWEKDSEHWAKVLKKGSSVVVQGCISFGEFKNQNGEIKNFRELNADSIGFVN